MRCVFEVIRRIEAFLLATAMIAMAVITIANVFARNVFNRNLAAVEELNQFLIVLICFVGLSYGASQGRHIRMTAVYDQFGRRGRKVLMVVISSTTAALLFTFAWVALRYAWSVDRTSPVLGVPLFLIYLAAPLGLALGGIQYVLTLVRNLTTKDVYISFDHLDAYAEVEGGQSQET